MSVAEVEEIADRTLVEEEVPRTDMTHYLRDGRTDVWFVFENDELKSVQVLWAQKIMKYASYQKLNLCDV